MKSAAPGFWLTGLAVLLIQAGCAGGDAGGSGDDAIAAVERWDRSINGIDCSEAWVIDFTDDPYSRHYVLQADCRYETTPTRGVYEAASYFHVIYDRDPFGGWEQARCERVSHPDVGRAWQRSPSYKGPPPANEIMEYFAATLTLPAALICAVLLGGFLLWHWSRR